MAILRKREIRQMVPDERTRKLDDLRTELTRLRSTVESGGRIDNPARIREIRRVIARILTVQAEERAKIVT